MLEIIIWMVIAIAAIIVLTGRYKIPAFFTLLLACFIVGLGLQMPANELLLSVKEGFGNILKSLGILIVLGTVLGVLLEHTGCTTVMANALMRVVGKKRAPLAMNITGFIIGLSVFCDSGYIVLSSLNRDIAMRTGRPMTMMAVSLASGLYAVHCLLPPHPGAAAAASLMGVSFGRVLVWGLLAALPAAIVGYLWALFSGRNDRAIAPEEEHPAQHKTFPPAWASFLPVIIPVLLISLKSLVTLEKDQGLAAQALTALGDPVIALAIGVLITCAFLRHAQKRLSVLLQEGIEKAGGILVIIGAGGAFGAVLASTHLGQQLSSMRLAGVGIIFPYVLTVFLKTAQGSSTVAIITSSSIVQPLLPLLGLATAKGTLLAVLSMGAGSMMISHANDAYFWVIARFSGLDMRSMLRTYTLSTIFMSLAAFASVFILSLAM